FSTRAVALRQRLAMLVGALDSAEIGALSGSGARDKKRHVRGLRQLRRRRGLLGLDAGCDAERQCSNDECLRFAHYSRLPLDFQISYAVSSMLAHFPGRSKPRQSEHRTTRLYSAMQGS